MDKYERINLVDEAEEALETAINLMEQAVSGASCESNVRAYWIDQLKTHLPDHGFLCRNTTTSDIRAMFESDELEEELEALYEEHSELTCELESTTDPEEREHIRDELEELERKCERLEGRIRH